MAYNIASNASTQQITNAVNYLLANFGSATNVNQVTGAITGPGNVIIAYLYKYLDVKYATSYDGSQGFSNSPTGATYYGLRNTNSNADDSNYADYVWYNTVGFGNTNFLYYIVTGGRSIQFAVASAPPDTGWVQATGYYIDLDIVTSGTTPVIQEGFVSYFTPGSFLVPRAGSPLAPVFTNITPALYSTDKGSVVQFSTGQTDTDVSFTNNTWRIGNSSTTGYADISKNNLTIGDPSLVATYAQWPQPTAVPNSPAFLTVPVRYKNSLGQVTQSNPVVLQFVYSDPGAQGPQGVGIDISGYTSFVQNSGGAFTPTSATLTGLLTNVTSPTYSWTISGATPTSATTASVVVTPTSSSTGVTATLTVTGTNISGSLSKTVNLPVVYDGVPGQAGANGQMSAFPTIYIWTGSATPPTRPSTTSTYTWSTGAYTAPSGWSTTAPSNTTPGNYLWSITVPLTVTATTTTSTLDWTNTSNAIRAIAYNGNNGANGTNGTNGTNGSSGSATFVVYRTANDSSAPTNAEVNAVIGRNPVAGDNVTVSYNNQNNATIYRYTTSWVLSTTYITGSLIVQNTITADKLSVTSLSAISANLGTVTAGTLTAGTTFAGALSAATGTFSGALSAATGSFAGTLNVGSSPAVSGTTMTGAGAVINNTGTFALGNSSTNISYNGSQMTLNGNVVATGNVNLNAISTVVSASLNAPSQVISFTNLSGVWPANTRTIPVSVTITPTSTNSSILINATSYFYTATHEYNVLEIWKVTSGTYTRLYYIGGAANVFDTSAQPYYGQILGGDAEAATIVDSSVTAGVSTTYFLVLGNNASASVYAAFPSINVTELKR